jgi:hypothetical protein
MAPWGCHANALHYREAAAILFRQGEGMVGIPRIDVVQARERVLAGALLVCAYEDEARCRRLALDGAMSLPRFRTEAPTLPRDRELIFYCG